MADPLISVVTVNLNGEHHLRAFLDSVFAQTFPSEDFEVILVDNGSTDGSVSFVREQYRSVHVIEGVSNVGFARAANLGSTAARGRYLALLNNDMRLPPGWLSELTACLEGQDSETVCASSRILNWDGTRTDFDGGTIVFTGGGVQHRYGQPVSELDADRRPEEILFPCGGAMLIDRGVFEEVGGFDEDYFAFFEDVDLGWRLWLLGYRVVYCPATVAYHRHHGTASQFDPYKLRLLHERNALYTIIKNYDDASLAAILPAALLLRTKHLALSSGIPREDFAVAPGSSPRPLPGNGPRRRLRTTREPIRSRVGIARRLNNTLVRMAGLTKIARLRSFRFISAGSYAEIVAMEDVVDHLPRLMEKRGKIQAARRRSDAELWQRFDILMEPPHAEPEYAAFYRSTLPALGLDRFFRELREVTPGAR